VARRQMSLRARIDEGTPLRIGELARYLGYSREQVRKWIDADVIKTVCLDEEGERRVPPVEAERIGKALRLL